MNILLNILNIIISLSLIVMGYIVPYMVLAFYARQRHTTMKSLISLKEKYKALSDVFTLSKVEGWSCGSFLIFIAVLHMVAPLALLYEMVYFSIIVSIVFFGVLLYLTGSLFKFELNNIDANLHNQSIKI